MAFVPVVNGMQVELRGLLHGQEYENVWYFLRSPEGSGPSAVAETIFDWLDTTWKQNFASQMVWDEVYMTDLNTATSPTYTFPLDTPIGGTASGTTLPGNVAACINFPTNGRGRSSHGRNYFGGLSGSEVTGNTIAGARITSLLDDLANLRGNLLAMHLWTWVVVSRETGGVPRVTGLAQPVTNFRMVTPYTRSQRRRNAGIGN